MSFPKMSAVMVANILRGVKPETIVALKTIAAAQSMSMSAYVDRVLAAHCKELLEKSVINVGEVTFLK